MGEGDPGPDPCLDCRATPGSARWLTLPLVLLGLQDWLRPPRARPDALTPSPHPEAEGADAAAPRPGSFRNMFIRQTYLRWPRDILTPAVLISRCFSHDQKVPRPIPEPKCLNTQSSSYADAGETPISTESRKTDDFNETHNPETRGPSEHLTHVDSDGKVTMVDVGMKIDSGRTAVATAMVRLGPKVFQLVQTNGLKKGDVLSVAQIAGIQGAKSTSQLIPLCHNITLNHVAVSLQLDARRYSVVITATCRSHGKTGVEMEALTAASVAALTVYDMCKAVSHDIVIEEVKLCSKTGGQRGDFQRPQDPPA